MAIVLNYNSKNKTNIKIKWEKLKNCDNYHNISIAPKVFLDIKIYKVAILLVYIGFGLKEAGLCVHGGRSKASYAQHKREPNGLFRASGISHGHSNVREKYIVVLIPNIISNKINYTPYN